MCDCITNGFICCFFTVCVKAFHKTRKIKSSANCNLNYALFPVTFIYRDLIFSKNIKDGELKIIFQPLTQVLEALKYTAVQHGHGHYHATQSKTQQQLGPLLVPPSNVSSEDGLIMKPSARCNQSVSWPAAAACFSLCHMVTRHWHRHLHHKWLSECYH